jgi:hypothetical protein
MQNFKGDALELQMEAVVEPIIEQVGIQKDSFYNEAYEAAPLGDLLWTSQRSPLANAILQDIFRNAFKQIFDAFVEAGSFESYLIVFRKVFGDDVIVEFTVPAPGKLEIDIEATGVEISQFVSRYIEDNEYFFDHIVDDVGDNICFRTVKGFETQYELEQMLFEMVPGGIFTTISLTIA